jgi:hypothetical protein
VDAFGRAFFAGERSPIALKWVEKRLTGVSFEDGVPVRVVEGLSGA